MCVLQLAQILLVLRKEGDALPLRFQDYTLLALVAAANGHSHPQHNW